MRQLNQQQWITIITAGVVAVIVLLIVALVVRNVLSARRATVQHASQMDQAERSISAGVAACDEAQNPDGCRQQLVEREVYRLSTAELCLALEGKALEDCVVSLARDRVEMEDCRVLKAEARDRCEDVVLYVTAKAQNDVRLCESIQNDKQRDQCSADITASVVVDGTCAEHGIDPTLCDRRAIMDAAARHLDVDRCNELDTQEWIESCQLMVEEALDDSAALDADGDGLSNGEEANLGTDPARADSDGDRLNDYDEVQVYSSDPLNQDTDGDGYIDGEEVENGYSPTGPGTL